MSDVRIVGPFKERRVVINGWQVPLLSASELDGGRFSFVVDNRIGMTCNAEHFESVACFLADTIAVCFGYGAHPRGDIPLAERREHFARVPHPSLAPSQVKEIGAADTLPRRIEEAS